LSKDQRASKNSGWHYMGLCTKVAGALLIPFTRSSWLDELAICYLDEPARCLFDRVNGVLLFLRRLREFHTCCSLVLQRSLDREGLMTVS